MESFTQYPQYQFQFRQYLRWCQLTLENHTFAYLALGLDAFWLSFKLIILSLQAG